MEDSTIEIKNDSVEKKTFNTDGFFDVQKSIGLKKNTRGINFKIYDDQQFATLYVTNGLAARVIDLVVSDMISKWIAIPDDTDNKIIKKLTSLNAQKEFQLALTNAHLFGGAVLFMVIDDGGMPSDPLNYNNIKSIKKLKCFSRSEIKIDDNSYYKDFTKNNFGEPEFFSIYPENGGSPFLVHESRCLVFQGKWYPKKEITAAYEKYWGISYLQNLYEKIEQYELAELALASVLMKFNMDIVKIKNLMKLLSTEDGKKALKDRAAIMAMASSVDNQIIIDTEEDFQVISQSLAGFADSLAKLHDTISRDTGIPQNILFGKSVGGLNATGDNEMRIYYDKIKASQEIEMEQPLNKIINIIKYSKEIQINKNLQYDCKFNSLWELTEDQMVKMRYEQSKMDEVYISNGVLDSREVRDSRFNNGYSIETKLAAIPKQNGD